MLQGVRDLEWHGWQFAVWIMLRTPANSRRKLCCDATCAAACCDLHRWRSCGLHGYTVDSGPQTPILTTTEEDATHGILVSQTHQPTSTISCKRTSGQGTTADNCGQQKKKFGEQKLKKTEKTRQPIIGSCQLLA